MTQSKDAAEPNARMLADLSALADGTLTGDRADAVRKLIDRSPELRRRYEQERQAVAALHALRSDRAPARLRIAVDERRRPAPARPRRVVFGGAVAAVAAAVAVAILLLPGAAPGSPSVSQAAALALRGPVMGPPPPGTTQNSGKLGQDVQDVYFPDWSGWFGWRAVGQRVDRIGGRLAVTVYYRRGDRQIAYTILASPALRWPAGATRRLDGVVLRTFGSGGRLIVTWRRGNHTCILSASRVSGAEMSRLATWRPPGVSS
jgi:hypothetical protein